MLLGCEGGIDIFRSFFSTFARCFGGSGPSLLVILDGFFFFAAVFFAGFFLDVFVFAIIPHYLTWIK
jgi:hypothetical protein